MGQCACGRDDCADGLRCDLPVVHRHRVALVLDVHPRYLRQGSSQFGGGAREGGDERRCGLVLVTDAVGSGQFESVAARVPDTGDIHPGPDVGEIPSAEDGDRALCGKELQGFGRTVYEHRRIGLGDDRRQRAVVIQEDHRIPGTGDTDQLAVGRQRIRQFRDVLVAAADIDIGQVVDQYVGGGAVMVDSDDQREAAIAAGRRAGRGIGDDDTSLRSHTEPAGGIQKCCGIGLLDGAMFTGHTVDAHAEQFVDAGGLQLPRTVRVGRADRCGDAGTAQLAGQGNGRAEQRGAPAQRTAEIEQHRVVVARIDRDRQLHDTDGASWRSSSSTWRVVLTTVSGFRLIDSMPTRTRNSAISG